MDAPSGSGTGGNGSSIGVITPFVKNTKVQDARCGVYDIARSPSDMASQRMMTAGGLPAKGVPAEPRPAQQDAIRRASRDAERQAATMVSSARAEEPVELANAGFALLDDLETLWGLRDERETDWRDLVNLIQGTLLKQDIERFSTEQCQAIQEAVSQYVAAATVYPDDVEQTIDLLENAGFDPWQAISGEHEGDGAAREQ